MAGREREAYVGSKGMRMTGSHDHEMMCLMKQAGRETCVFTFPGEKAWLSELQRFYYSHCRVLEISLCSRDGN